MRPTAKGSTHVTRARLRTAALLTGLLLAGPAGTAMAEDEPTPSPSTAPSTALAEENEPPLAAPDQGWVQPGSSVVIPVLDNDTDDGVGRPEGEEPRLEVVDVRDGGDRFTYSPTDVTFTAATGDSGTYVGEYDVTDGTATSTAQITVQVMPTTKRAVSISMAERPAVLKTYAISGQVEPLTAGRATVRVQRRTADGWTGHGRDRTDPDGRYSVAFRTDKPGERTFRAVAVWAEGPKATSDPITRRVRAVANPVVSGPLTASQVPHSWRTGCPVPPSKLRKIHINRLTYDRRIARGAIVVRADEAGDIVRVFTAALDARFPVRIMKPADHFYDGGRRTPMESDQAAMRAGNTSAFNCRPVTGNPYRVSQHSYGNAIDINTIENPYVTGSTVYPPGSREYLDRSPYRRGMILRGGVVADRMRHLGWLWGARWSHPDYQHFSSNGG